MQKKLTKPFSMENSTKSFSTVSVNCSFITVLSEQKISLSDVFLLSYSLIFFKNGTIYNSPNKRGYVYDATVQTSGM